MWTPKRFFSPEQVEAAMTAHGGFSRQSLAKLGVPFPPPKGWRKAITQQAPTAWLRQDRIQTSHHLARTRLAERIARDDRHDNPSQRTPEEWYALIPKLAHWAFK